MDIDLLLDTLGNLLGGERRKVEASEVAATDNWDEGAGAASDIGAASQFDSMAGAPIFSRLASGGERIQATIAKFIIRVDDQLDAMESCCSSSTPSALVSIKKYGYASVA